MKTVDAESLGISAHLLHLIHVAISRALKARQGNDWFAPFAMVQTHAGEGGVTVPASGSVDQLTVMARWLVTTGRAPYLVIALHGFVTGVSTGPARTEAVIVEAYEEGLGHGVRLIQRYSVDSAGPAQRIGNLIFDIRMPLPTEAKYGPLFERQKRQDLHATPRLDDN